MESCEFEIVFKNLYPVLCRYALTLVSDKAIAEDIVQEQFANLWEYDNRKKIHSIEAYLFKAIKNKSINYLRSYSTRNVKRLDTLVEDTFNSTTGDQLEFQELVGLIDEAIKLLPEKCSAIFFMKRFEGLSIKEIAEKLSISEKTVENQITIAIHKIAAHLKKKNSVNSTYLMNFLLTF
jgi:RNA polymerase sigma-70 factor, ECF subfamily